MKLLNRLLWRADVPEATVPKAIDDKLRPLYTLVPGAPPIELIDYYREFAGYYPECELQTKRWFVENVGNDWVIFDVGANVGYYSILFSRLAPSGRVFAFEPTETIRKFNRNVAFHKCENVVAFERALGASAGRIEEDVYRIWGQPPERMTYTFSTIDAMARELELARLDCLKIDVDSFDFEVLQGAEQTLERFDPWIVVELNHALARRNHSAPEAFQWLAERGYRSALVLDHENFVLRRAGQGRGTGLPRLELTFDTKPLFLESALEKAGERSSPFAPAPHRHNDTRIEGAAGVWQIEVKGPRWSYAAEWPLVSEEQTAFFVDIDVLVEGGDIGFSFLAADGSTILGETIVEARSFRQTATLLKPEAEPIAGLLLRNADANGTAAQARILGIRCFDVAPARPTAPSRILTPSVSSISAREMAEALGESTESYSGSTIEVMPVGNLGHALGFERPFMPTALYRHKLADFKTERDETPIFEFIYGNFRPRRHLEIGTWEGHGATTVARASDAEIWTVNLPEGERNAEGKPMYPHADSAATADPVALQPTDAGAAIGWRYREAGFGPRVHQILGNSMELDYAQWSPGFFDTIFIDGGHTMEVVVNDTEKTLALLRSGGLMIWHDFCPDPLTLSQNEAPRGVVAAVAANLPRWRPRFTKMFWIRPSWILIGIKE
ncbi:FkbM family methyltransferase [Reyranella sp.]|jgi:FkbM family methyltransferase|uniref:class I SAM-dependent methyltransferase n=1 Tax=Reyranella sp. TaxID=1929291 RepID=UPI002F948589